MKEGKKERREEIKKERIVSRWKYIKKLSTYQAEWDESDERPLL